MRGGILIIAVLLIMITRGQSTVHLAIVHWKTLNGEREERERREEEGEEREEREEREGGRGGGRLYNSFSFTVKLVLRELVLMDSVDQWKGQCILLILPWNVLRVTITPTLHRKLIHVQ